MSGTSMDGVDVAMIETDGGDIVRRGPFASFPYTPSERVLLRQALADAVSMRDRNARPGALADAETMVTDRHCRAVADFLSANAIDGSGIAVIGFHGQTVLHRPHERLTVQIGSGAALARATGLRVVFDFRAADVAAGGQGAPLVPVYHRALVNAAGMEQAVAIANIGGVANITFIGAGGAEPIAFDTGPGNALIDDLMLERTGQGFDLDGETAARGVVDESVLAAMLDHPYFARPFPKSLDRNAFSRDAVAGLATPDAAATLTAFTARALGLALDLLPFYPRRLIVCGGGARNRTLLTQLRRLRCAVMTADECGWSADAMEAEAFAYLAVRALKGLPITFPGTTGVAAAMTGGVIAP